MKMGLAVRTGITHKQGPRQLPSTAAVIVFAFTMAILIGGRAAWAQSSHTTVRRHRVEDPSADALTKAEAAIDNRDYASAEPLLRQVVEAHPESYAAWYDLGFVCHERGERAESIAAYRKSVAANPNVFESNLNLGIALADAGEPDAETFLRAATRLKPASQSEGGLKRAWLALGQLLASRNPDAAIEAYEQAASADPNDTEPRLLAGSLLERQDRPADAEKQYQRALTADPNSSDAMAALTNLYMQQRRFPDAESLLRKLVILRPQDASVHLQLGRMLVISGKNDEAVAEMETGIKLDPSDRKAQHDLADFYADTGKYAQAEQLYTTLLIASPRDAGLHYDLGRCFLKQKKFAAAEQELKQAVALQPDLGSAYGELAVAAEENQDYPLAIQAADLRAKYLPETPMSYFLRATAYDHLRDTKQAAKYYHQFLDVAEGKYPEQEWQARHRLIAIEPKK